MKLPVQPPIQPMLAVLSRQLPEENGWIFEPKWDGFRALVFWDGDELMIQSRDLKPLGRYFPELEEHLKRIIPKKIVLDGEVVIASSKGLDFDALQMRIHPAASRIAKLAKEIPASFVAFDLLAHLGTNYMNLPFEKRRKKLELIASRFRPPVYLTPATTDIATAKDWFVRFEGAGLDGVIAKEANEIYIPGKRVMMKIKHQRTIDCVVGGFRWYKDQKGKAIGSLLLGLYRGKTLHYVGHASNFQKEERQKLVKFLKPYRDKTGADGFGAGRAPGGISRWSQADAATNWVRLRPELVCEVAFDHLQGERFRHAASFLRWRHDKPRKECTFDQIETAVPFELQQIFKWGT
ncbi:ATP-dependent DNA ligase [bacterium]|nr:ATP-dependent DNA ligase [bacterium]MCI0607073.1 ATP-dependent DNA ligase [bacterium]